MSRIHCRMPAPLSLLVVLPLVSGCAQKDLVDQLAADMRQLSDSLTEVVRPIPHVLIGEASHAFEDSLRPVLDSTVASLLMIVEREVAALEDSLAAYVASDLNDSLSVLIESNLTLARERVSVALDDWVSGLSAALAERVLPLVDTELGPRLAIVADTALGQAAATLAARLSPDGDLRNAVVTLAGDVVDRALERIADNNRPTPWWIWAIAIGFGLIAVAAFGLLVLRLKQALDRRDASLRLVTLAVKEIGDPAVKNRVRELASQQGVESWLHSYLEENRLLMENGAAVHTPGKT